ncbi:type II toxin-antitoxin system VapC family toxin [Thermococcus peptonophilus]|uniref:PIN domain-containing protein n=1 Tax=Thermococcus peptonophilus TaxID=53952 RepID=A0A142CVR1_9EURY|nr:type II toxin-antitoxin system VapC family toxin [Thermococcus peptonophilus]AMQ18863.1 PIN domain-containing protein [Thermococcus peptonophilus]
MGSNKKKFYDTNVLIDAARNRDSLEEGYTTVLNLVEYPKAALLDLNLLIPTVKEYALAVELSEKLVKEGTPVPAVDIVIAAVSISRGLTLITKDKHFEKIKKVAPELQVEFLE